MGQTEQFDLPLPLQPLCRQTSCPIGAMMLAPLLPAPAMSVRPVCSLNRLLHGQALDSVGRRGLDTFPQGRHDRVRDVRGALHTTGSAHCVCAERCGHHQQRQQLPPPTQVRRPESGNWCAPPPNTLPPGCRAASTPARPGRHHGGCTG